jgi:hypothetical protein
MLTSSLREGRESANIEFGKMQETQKAKFAKLEKGNSQNEKAFPKSPRGRGFVFEAGRPGYCCM